MAGQGLRREEPADGPRDPVRKTCKTERAVQIELGKLLEQAGEGRQPETDITWPS